MNSFGSRSKLRAGNQEYEIYRLNVLERHDCEPQRLPFCLKILLENLLRTENGRSVTADDVHFLANWNPLAIPDKEIAFTPARVLILGCGETAVRLAPPLIVEQGEVDVALDILEECVEIAQSEQNITEITETKHQAEVHASQS